MVRFNSQYGNSLTDNWFIPANCWKGDPATGKFTITPPPDSKKPDFKPVDAKRLGKPVFVDQEFPAPTISKAKLGGGHVYSAEFLNEAGLPSSATAAKSLRRLVEDGLVFVHGKEYRFFNPFLRAWLIRKGF